MRTTAAISGRRRVSQLDLSTTGGSKGLRQVWVVGVCRRLGIAHAGAQSLVVTHTNTHDLVHGHGLLRHPGANGVAAVIGSYPCPGGEYPAGPGGQKPG